MVKYSPVLPRQASNLDKCSNHGPLENPFLLFFAVARTAGTAALMWTDLWTGLTKCRVRQRDQRMRADAIRHCERKCCAGQPFCRAVTGNGAASAPGHG